MTFDINTHDIQKVVMCIAFVEGLYTVSQEDKDKYIDILTALNNLCSKESNYTLTVTATTKAP